MSVDSREGLAKQWAERWGVSGRTGGWLYDEETDAPVVQGWYALYVALRWVKIISPTGRIANTYATPRVLRSAYRQAVAYQSRTGKYL